MDKNIFFIIFLLLFLISIFFIYKLDLCRTNYQKLSNILKRNSVETLHLLNKVVQLKKNNKGNLLINHKNLYSNVNETFQSNQNCNLGNPSGNNSNGNGNGNCPPCNQDEPCPSCRFFGMEVLGAAYPRSLRSDFESSHAVLLG